MRVLVQGAITFIDQIQRYPDGLAWQFNVAKKVLRKSPEFKRFHNFLVFETEVVRNNRLVREQNESDKSTRVTSLGKRL